MFRAPWPFRILWLALPLALGPALAAALDDRSRSIQLVGSGLAWAAWLLVAAASYLPRTVTLTVVRLVAPGAVVAAAWSAGVDATRGSLAIGGALITAFAAAAPATTDAFVDGSSYGSERRVALRIPLSLLLGPIPLAWAAFAAAVVTGPLLLGAQQWLAGGVAIALGIPVAFVVARQVHLLSRRWLVFVPAGVVVHDPMTLVEPILLQRQLVASLGPAAPDTTSLDVTAGALGLVLDIRTAEPVEVGLRRGRDGVETTGVDGLLVCVLRPAVALELAGSNRLRVG